MAIFKAVTFSKAHHFGALQPWTIFGGVSTGQKKHTILWNPQISKAMGLKISTTISGI